MKNPRKNILTVDDRAYINGARRVLRKIKRKRSKITSYEESSMFYDELRKLHINFFEDLMTPFIEV